MMITVKCFPTDFEFLAILEGYCAGKSLLWNTFFGWRREDREGFTYYKISKKA